ncbi:MAG: hypothetical protein KKG60_00010, partial [Nanoarchaeota archaeon]|nr:hypothetical protein [Nanoarchaeota archaeon]
MSYKIQLTNEYRGSGVICIYKNRQTSKSYAVFEEDHDQPVDFHNIFVKNKGHLIDVFSLVNENFYGLVLNEIDKINSEEEIPTKSRIRKGLKALLEKTNP